MRRTDPLGIAPKRSDVVQLGRTWEDASELRRAFGLFPTGIAALCADIDGSPAGLVASSFSVGVSFAPAIVMFSIQATSRTWPILQQSSNIGVSILGEDHQDICMRLASRKGDRFQGLNLTHTSKGSVFIDAAVMWLETSVLSETPAGDHSVVLLEVEGLSYEADRKPLVYQAQRFHQLIPQ